MSQDRRTSQTSESATASRWERVAAVVIGRNEGQRLRACLESVLLHFERVVYVDSGSDDGSVLTAERAGAQVHRLDPSRPFTAARARQEGLDLLLAADPDLPLVHFIDGDCVMQREWPAAAVAALDKHADVAAVTGRRREERPDASVWNRLIDIDWDIPPGDVPYVGGDALFRVDPLREAGGWPLDLIAGEEPDLCFRMRKAGWRILRLRAEMTLHDVAMGSFAEYWRRSVRSGHACVEVAARHPGPIGFPWRRQTLSIVCYGLGLPFVIAGSALFWWPLVLVGLLWLKPAFGLFHRARKQGRSWSLSLGYALVNMVCKVGGSLGVLRFIFGRLTGQRSGIMEYKKMQAAPREQTSGS